MVALRASKALTSAVISLLHCSLALVLSAARLVRTVSRAVWIPALPSLAGSIWSSWAIDAFSAAASAQAWDAGLVVALAVVAAGAAPLVLSPELPQAAETRQTKVTSMSLTLTGVRMMSSMTKRTATRCGGAG